jgi:hypothetical protein
VPAEQNTGWLGWMLHSPGASATQLAKDDEEVIEAVSSFTNQEKKMFYSLIGYSESEPISTTLTSAPRKVCCNTADNNDSYCCSW